MSSASMMHMTKAQATHLQAAEAGELHANWHGGPIRRWVMTGSKASQRVCERLYADGQITLVPVPGCSVKYRAALTQEAR